MMDDRRDRGDHGGALRGCGLSALPCFTRLSEAEAQDLHLFIAPERLAKSRRMLEAGLSRPSLAEARTSCNDNRA